MEYLYIHIFFSLSRRRLRHRCDCLSLLLFTYSFSWVSLSFVPCETKRFRTNFVHPSTWQHHRRIINKTRHRRVIVVVIWPDLRDIINIFFLSITDENRKTRPTIWPWRNSLTRIIIYKFHLIFFFLCTKTFFYYNRWQKGNHASGRLRVTNRFREGKIWTKKDTSSSSGLWD